MNWPQWSNPILVVLYGVSGLLFAVRFLDLRLHFPQVRQAVLAYCALPCVLLAAAMLAGSQKYALLISFTFVFLFTGIMLLLDVMLVRAGQKPAKYFLIATITASFGVAEKDRSHHTLDALIASADGCLYQAKQQGRNRMIGNA